MYDQDMASLTGVAYPNSLVVGIIGPSGSGKDAFSNAIKEAASVPVLRSAMADALREEIERELTGKVGVQLDGLRHHPLSEPARWVLQQYGTEFRRARDNQWWVNQNAERIRGIMDSYAQVIITVPDVRFPNEVAMVEGFAGIVVWVDRPVAEVYLAAPHVDRNHASETSLLPWDTHADMVVTNDGDLEALTHVARQFLNDFAGWAVSGT
jgi:hypothetical protein